MSKPFSPDEAAAARISIIPDVVIDAVNILLASRWDGKKCVLRQDEIISAIQDLSAVRGIPFNRAALFANHHMDFEPLYQKEGWSIYYDKPAFCESYEPTFTFTRKSKSN